MGGPLESLMIQSNSMNTICESKLFQETVLVLIQADRQLSQFILFAKQLLILILPSIVFFPFQSFF